MKHVMVMLGVLAMATMAFASSPYYGSPLTISNGANINCYEFDLGGNIKEGGDAYYDWSDGSYGNLFPRAAVDPNCDTDFSNWWGNPVILTERDGSAPWTYGAGETLTYTTYVTQPGIYDLNFYLRINDPNAPWGRGNAVHLYDNNNLVGIVGCSVNGTYTAHLMPNVILGPGTHNMRLEFHNDGYKFKNFTFSFIETPEPATALFLLGGLPFLRRRRA